MVREKSVNVNHLNAGEANRSGNMIQQCHLDQKEKLIYKEDYCL